MRKKINVIFGILDRANQNGTVQNTSQKLREKLKSPRAITATKILTRAFEQGDGEKGLNKIRGIKSKVEQQTNRDKHEHDHQNFMLNNKDQPRALKHLNWIAKKQGSSTRYYDAKAKPKGTKPFGFN